MLCLHYLAQGKSTLLNTLLGEERVLTGGWARKHSLLRAAALLAEHGAHVLSDRPEFQGMGRQHWMRGHARAARVAVGGPA